MKIRRVDFSPDEWLAGTAELSEFDRGVYITICALIYSRGERIGEELLRRHCQAHGNAINSSLSRLEVMRKITRNGSEIGQKRSENELETVQKRLRNASENGIFGNEIKKVRAATRMNGAHANHQLPTINHKRNPLKSPKGDDGFEDFWQVYPKKVGKQDARKAWPKAIKAADLSAIVEGARSYAASHEPSYEFWKNPSGWLTGKRWQDQPATLLDRVNGHGGGQTGPPPAPVEPKKLGHFADCTCGNCSRWAVQHQQGEH